MLVKSNSITNFFFFLILVSLFFQRYYLDIGFALKIIYAISFIYIFFIKKMKFHIKIYNIEFAIFVFFALYIISVIYSIDIMSSFRLILGIILLLLFYFSIREIFIDMNINEEERIIKKSFYIVFLFSLFYYFIGLISIGNFITAEQNVIYYGALLERGIPRLTGAVVNTNFLAIFVTFFFFFFTAKNRKTLAVLSLFLILLTFSRGAILSIVMGMLITYLILFPKKFFKPILYVIFLLTFVFVIYLLNSDFIVFDMIEKRLTQQGTSGRLDYWVNAINIFLINPFLGTGIHTSLILNEMHYLHNTYLDILLDIGFLGFAFYIIVQFVILIDMFFHCKKYKVDWYVVAIFISLIISNIFLSAVISEFYFLIIAYYIAIKIRRGKYETKCFNVNNGQ